MKTQVITIDPQSHRAAKRLYPLARAPRSKRSSVTWFVRVRPGALKLQGQGTAKSCRRPLFLTVIHELARPRRSVRDDGASTGPGLVGGRGEPARGGAMRRLAFP